tara:strand:- start:776 stop:1024 length:249 start_codon:yes stop_codon:yes gene_type:complete
MIMPNNRFGNQEEPSSREQTYQYCISEIFDYVHNLSSRLGISMEESLGLLDIVKGSIKLNISINKREQQEEQESEESDYDDY